MIQEIQSDFNLKSIRLDWIDFRYQNQGIRISLQEY